MPVPTMFGVLASGAAGSGAAYITEHHYSPATSQAVSFSGAAAGQLALIIVSNSLTAAPSPPAGWTSLGSYTWATFGYKDTAFWKILSAGDISTGSVTVTGLGSDGTLEIVFYSGVTSIALVGTGDSTTSTVNIPGFTKSGSCKGIVTYCTTRATGSSPAAPGTATNRVAVFGAGNFKTRVDDILNPSNYVDGSDLPYTNVGALEAIGRAYELT